MVNFQVYPTTKKTPIFYNHCYNLNPNIFCVNTEQVPTCSGLGLSCAVNVRTGFWLNNLLIIFTGTTCYFYNKCFRYKAATVTFTPMARSDLRSKGSGGFHSSFIFQLLFSCLLPEMSLKWFKTSGVLF